MQAVAQANMPIVRRPTGGQAVWHEHDVTYAVAAPIAMFGSLRAAYHEIHARLAAALRSLGADVLLAPQPAPSLRSGQAVRPSARPTVCFAASAGGEILHRGRKLVGSAQVRKRNAFLQHGSILLSGSQPGSLNGEITLTEILGRTVTFTEVASAVITAWPSVIASVASE
jgi:lipoate-protein ligase A